MATQHNSIRILQRFSRRFLAKLEMCRVLAAVSILQRATRAMIARMHDDAECYAVTEIQRVWRGYRLNADFMVMVTCATTIQAVIRGRRARFDTAIQRNAISTLQRAARSMLTRIQSEVQSFAATEIQRVWRGYRENVDFMIAVMSSIKIQAIVRGRQARQDMATQHNSIRILQRFSRRFLAKLEMCRGLAAVSILQRAARVTISRVNCETEFFAASTIQRRWRGHRVQLFARRILAEGMAVKMAKTMAAAVEKDIKCERALVKQRLNVNKPRLRIQSEVNVAAMKNGRYGSTGKYSAVHSVERDVVADYGKEIGRASQTSNKISRIQKSSFIPSSLTKRNMPSFSNSIQRNRAMHVSSRSCQSKTDRIQIEQALAEQRQSGYKPRLHIQSEVNATAMKAVRHESIGKCSFINSVQRNEVTRHDVAIGRALHTSNQTNVVPKPSSIPSSRTNMNTPSFSTSIQRKKIEVSEKDEVPKILHIRHHTTKFGAQTSKAMRTIETSKKFSEVQRAITSLENITRQSMEDCEVIVKTDAQHELFSIIRSCNRSSPHMELIRVILVVLTNLAKHPSLLTRLATDKSIGALTDLIHMFRDKSTIFALSSSLLETLLRSSNVLTSKYSTLENKKRLRGILLMSKEKASSTDDMRKGIRCLENAFQLMNALPANPRPCCRF